MRGGRKIFCRDFLLHDICRIGSLCAFGVENLSGRVVLFKLSQASSKCLTQIETDVGWAQCSRNSATFWA